MTFPGTDYGEPWSFKEWGLRPDDGPTKFRLMGGDQGGNPITLGFTHGYSRLDQETAERIVACVNALASMAPAMLAALLEACDRYLQAWPLADDGTCTNEKCDSPLCGLRGDLFRALAALRGEESHRG